MHGYYSNHYASCVSGFSDRKGKKKIMNAKRKNAFSYAVFQ
jgi:hypothetical protein